MTKRLVLVIGLTFFALQLSAQDKPVLVVKVFTTAAGVDLPYDMKLMQSQLVPELRVMLKDFNVVAEPPAAGEGTI